MPPAYLHSPCAPAVLQVALTIHAPDPITRNAPQPGQPRRTLVSQRGAPGWRGTGRHVITDAHTNERQATASSASRSTHSWPGGAKARPPGLWWQRKQQPGVSGVQRLSRGASAQQARTCSAHVSQQSGMQTRQIGSWLTGVLWLQFQRQQGHRPHLQPTTSWQQAQSDSHATAT